MFQEILKHFRESERRGFSCFQVEVSSNCFLSCVMCPRTTFIDQWKSMNMSFETFKKMSYYFPYTNLVYLSGWGEPLLNRRIFDMIKLAKDYGCSVGFTTNGALLTEQVCRKLIALDLDIISISLAGATKKTHELMRVGSDFDQVTKNIGMLARLKKHFNTTKPKILLLITTTTENIGELPLAVKVSADLGVNELVATNLAYIATSYHDKIKTFSCDHANEKFLEKIREAEQDAKKVEIKFKSYSLKTEEVLVCDEDPLNNIYISCDGFVSPCVYLNPPIEKVRRVFCGENYSLQRTYFGEIKEEDLFEIWNKKEYQIFRQKFEKRLALKSGATDFSYDLLEKINEGIKANPLPEVCKTCYKAFGI